MSLWTQRDQPVLHHLAEAPPQHNVLMTHRNSENSRPDLPEVSERDFHMAVLTLADARYVTWSDSESEVGGHCHFFDSS